MESFTAFALARQNSLTWKLKVRFTQTRLSPWQNIFLRWSKAIWRDGQRIRPPLTQQKIGTSTSWCNQGHPILVWWISNFGGLNCDNQGRPILGRPIWIFFLGTIVISNGIDVRTLTFRQFDKLANILMDINCHWDTATIGLNRLDMWCWSAEHFRGNGSYFQMNPWFP